MERMVELVGENVRVHAALLLVHANFAGQTFLTKYAFNAGLNPSVYVVYREGVGAIVLLFMALIIERGKRPTAASYGYVIAMCFAGGLTGIFGNQQLYSVGLSMSSAQLASTMLVTIPVFSFLVALIFRVEEISLARMDGVMRTGGMLFCAGGATVITLYQGPVISLHTSNNVLYTNPVWNGGYFFLPQLQLATWQVGCLLTLGASISIAIYVNIQRPLLARFTAPISVTALSFIIGEVMLILAGIVAVKESSDWYLKKPIEIFSVAYGGLITSALSFSVRCWCSYKAGPIITACYSPVENVLVFVAGAMFLNEGLHIGSWAQ